MVKIPSSFFTGFREKPAKKPRLALGRGGRIPYVSVPGVQSRDRRPL